MGGVGLLNFRAWKDGGRGGERYGRDPQNGEAITGRGREGGSTGRQSTAEVETGDRWGIVSEGRR